MEHGAFPSVSVQVQHGEPGNMQPYNLDCKHILCTFDAKLDFSCWVWHGSLETCTHIICGHKHILCTFEAKLDFFLLPSLLGRFFLGIGHKLISNFIPHKTVSKRQADSCVRTKEGRTTWPNTVRDSVQWCCPDDK